MKNTLNCDCGHTMYSYSTVYDFIKELDSEGRAVKNQYEIIVYSCSCCGNEYEDSTCISFEYLY